MSDNELKVGDSVILTHFEGFSRERQAVVPVIRLTPTRVTVQFGAEKRQFNRRGFMEEIGSYGFHKPHIEVATPERIAQVLEANERRALTDYIRSAQYEKYTTEQLREIAALIRGDA